MKLKALGDSILFAFTDTTRDGYFATKTNSAIIIARDDMVDQKNPRWGTVIAVGPKVGSEIKVGGLILIDSLKWTIGLRTGETVDTTVWKTTYPNVCAISDKEFPPI